MEPRDVVPTYRVLTEPIYDFDFWFIRLTWVDTVICGAIAITFWGIYDLLGLYNWTILGFEFDTTIAGFATGILAAVIISTLHWLRPEGSIEVYLLGLSKPTKYVGRTGDRSWKPSLRPHWRKK